MEQVAIAVLVGAAVLLAAWIGWGLYSSSQAESVPYERTETLDGVELREYPETVLVATTAPDQRTAFGRLFDYIAGENGGEETIAMTAPVATGDGASIAMTTPVRSEAADAEGDGEPDGDGDAEGIRMAFSLPAEYGPETAPEPTDPELSLVTEPPTTVAVTRFSWYALDWRVDRQERALLSTLEEQGIATVGEPYLLRYDDPWTPPFMRRNEVAVEVEVED